ncbi:hypothetical protein [Sphingopyxis sp.]
MKLPKIKIERVTLSDFGAVQVTLTVGPVNVLFTVTWSKGGAK